jgi:hypothetical protein
MSAAFRERNSRTDQGEAIVDPFLHFVAFETTHEAFSGHKRRQHIGRCRDDASVGICREAAIDIFFVDRGERSSVRLARPNSPASTLLTFS